jgi:cysteinyl-tRNA synthetase
MAKSTGNIARVADLMAGGASTRALRYALISVHYRMGLAYSEESLAAATAAVARLDAVFAALGGYREDGPDDAGLEATLDAARTGFEAALDDDLNISPALAAVFDLVRDLNRRIVARTLSTGDAERALAVLAAFDTVLGVGPDAVDDLEPDLRALLDARAEARRTRDWAASDRLRDELAERGVGVEDTRDGQRWRRSEAVTHG